MNIHSRETEGFLLNGSVLQGAFQAGGEVPSTSSWEAERHCREYVDGLDRPSCQPGNCQENTRHIRLYLCGSYRDRVNPSKWKSQLTTPFTCGSALQPGREAKLPQGASLCKELLTPADTQRDRKRPQTKQFPASLTFPTWKGCSVRSGSYQDRYLGTSYHIYPALEYPLRMLRLFSSSMCSGHHSLSPIPPAIQLQPPPQDYLP